MVRSSIAVVVGLILLGPTDTSAQEEVAAAPPSSSHTVIRGETLWALAHRYYDNPFHWPTIFEANRAGIADPHWIYPEQVFVIPGAPTHPPRPLPVRSGGAVTAVGVTPAGGGGGSPENVEPGDDEGEYRTVFYQDPMSTRGGIIAAERNSWVAVPTDVFYSAPWLAPEVTGPDPLGVVTAFHKAEEVRFPRRTARAFERLRISLEQGVQLSLGDELMSVRVRRIEEGLGQVVEPTGRLTVSRVEPGGVVAVVTREFDRIQLEDLVLLAPPFELEPGIHPQAVNDGFLTRIIGFGEVHELQGLGDYVFLDVQGRGPVAVGDELTVVINPDDLWSSDLEGKVQVVGVRDGVATARIVALDNPVFVEGAVVRLIRKMP